MLKRYIAYLKDNPERFWFKRKLFGFGWTPATWQGWLITLVYLVVVLALALILTLTVDENSSGREIMFTFFLPLVFITTLFIRIAYKKGEKPRWQWGSPRRSKGVHYLE